MTTKKDLKKQVIIGSRQYGINMTLFRHVIGGVLGVNVTDMECMGLLFHKGLATPSELSKHTGLSSGATTAMLDRLVKTGLIERQPNPNDKRGVHIVFVKERAPQVGELFAGIRARQDELMQAYTKAELELLHDFFGRSSQMWEEEREILRLTIEGLRT